MRCLQRILEIKLNDVVDNNISNVSIRKMFHNIETIESQISKRRLSFLGKITRSPYKLILTRLIVVFYTDKRSLGRPKYTVKYSMLNDLGKSFLMSINSILFILELIWLIMSYSGRYWLIIWGKMILSYKFNLHKRKVNSLNLLLLSYHSILKYLLPQNYLLIFLPKMPVIVLELVKFSTSLKSTQPLSKKSYYCI